MLTLYHKPRLHTTNRGLSMCQPTVAFYYLSYNFMLNSSLSDNLIISQKWSIVNIQKALHSRAFCILQEISWNFMTLCIALHQIRTNIQRLFGSTNLKLLIKLLIDIFIIRQGFPLFRRFKHITYSGAGVKK